MSEKQMRKAVQRRVQARSGAESGKPLSQAARELGINNNMLNWWSREERDAQVSGKSRDDVKTDQEKPARLRRELARVTAERDFLKRAAAFFAKSRGNFISSRKDLDDVSLQP